MLRLVPLIRGGYYYCILNPGDLSLFWPARWGFEAAVPLEVDPGWWMLPDEPWLGTYEQGWPADVARNCSRLGYEVSLTEGIPLIGRELLPTKEDYFWHHLTLGLISPGQPVGQGEEWRVFRDELLDCLSPDSWKAPRSCEAVLHIGEADYLVILTPSKGMWQSWVAGHIAAHFNLSDPGSDETGEALLHVTRWLLKEGAEQGVRVSHLEINRLPHRTVVEASGRWGRGRKTLIQAGNERGEPFRREFIVSTDPGARLSD